MSAYSQRSVKYKHISSVKCSALFTACNSCSKSVYSLCYGVQSHCLLKLSLLETILCSRLVYVQGLGPITCMLPVEAFAIGIKLWSSDQCHFTKSDQGIKVTCTKPTMILRRHGCHFEPQEVKSFWTIEQSSTIYNHDESQTLLKAKYK